MKMRPKEILKNKSDKMIDLIVDEIEEGGEKEISASFMHRGNIKYTLTVKVQSQNLNFPDIPVDDYNDIEEEEETPDLEGLTDLIYDPEGEDDDF